MADLIHASYYQPRIFPIKGDVEPSEIDRAQSIDPTVSLNRVKVDEIGRVKPVGYIKKSPSVGYRLTQYENGSLEFFQKLVNSTVLGNDGETEITLSDFRTSYFDICAYLTDNDNTFVGTVHYPSLRTSGFSFTIGDPQAIIERSFDFVGENANIWKDNNKYFIYKKHTCGSGDDDEIDLSAKVPTEDPDEAGVYMFRVVRVRSGVSTELVRAIDYNYSDGTKVLTITSVLTDDVIKVYYTSVTAPDVLFTNNDSDVSGILGDSVSIYLYVPGSGKPSSSDYIYRLQSVTIDVSFDREDTGELGNKAVVARGITNSTVTVTMGKKMGQWTLEEALRGVDTGFGKIDVSKLSDRVSLIVKVFEDNTKDPSVFKYGFKATGLSPMELRGGPTVNANVDNENTLEGEDLIISADLSVLGI